MKTESLSQRLQDLACAVSLTEKGVEALADRRSPTTRKSRRTRWLWGAVPAAAAAVLAIFLLLRSPHQPKDTFTDPTLAYVELTRAFSLFSEALQEIDEPVFCQEAK